MESCCEQGNSQSGGTKLNHKQQRKLVCGFEVCLCSLCFIEIVQYTINLSKSNQSLQGFLHSHFNMLVLELLAWWLSVTNNNSPVEEYTKWTINCLPQIMYLILVVGGGGGVLRISSDGDDQNLGAGKTKTQNNPQGFQQNPHKTWTININPQNCHAYSNSQAPVWLYFFAELWCWEGHYHKSSPKKSLLKLNHPKKTWQIFPPKNIPEWKISNPRKSFDHPHHLKSRVPPPPPPPSPCPGLSYY